MTVGTFTNTLRGALLLGALTAAPGAFAAAECGGFEFAELGGPWDYNSAEDRAAMLGVVEAGHFDANVENLIRGLSSIHLMDDISYTLRRFPNHHRALYSMARYYLRNPEEASQPNRKTPDCYFHLAMQFTPDDGVVRMIYGIYLHRIGRYQDALTRYREAEQRMPETSELYYNMGLTYMKMRDYPNARRQADRAYALGYPLPGLKRMLEKVGH